MCKSKAEGGRRCSAHTRAALDRALKAHAAAPSFGAYEQVQEAWAEHASTAKGRAEVVALLEQADGPQEHDLLCALRRGDELAERFSAVEQALKGNRPEESKAAGRSKGAKTTQVVRPAGENVSLSLASRASGLSRADVEVLFSQLRAEAAEMPAPSEMDVAAWRDRQNELIEQGEVYAAEQVASGSGTGVSSRWSKMRDRLARARAEPIPDGPTFYAWSRVEGRARQEAVIRKAGGAVDLDPPGSQAHLYDLGEDGRPKRVWYASYGSNLNEQRFLTYIEGGRPPGSTRTYAGCDDRTRPEASVPMRFNGRPHFALTSTVWRGGIAFMDTHKAQAQALGRAYLISVEQYDQVVAQENGGPSLGAAKVPLDEVLASGRHVQGSGPYETMVHVGDFEGAPVLTFTSPFSTRDAMVRSGSVTRGNVRLPVMTNRPSAAYARMIGSGLEETFGLSKVQQADYLRGCPGGDRWARKDLVAALRAPEPPVSAPATAVAGVSPPPQAAVGKAAAGRAWPKKASGSRGADGHGGASSGAGVGGSGRSVSGTAGGFPLPSGRRPVFRKPGAPSAGEGGAAGGQSAGGLSIPCDVCGRGHIYGSIAHRSCVLKKSGNRMFTPSTMPDSMMPPRPASMQEATLFDAQEHAGYVSEHLRVQVAAEHDDPQGGAAQAEPSAGQGGKAKGAAPPETAQERQERLRHEALTMPLPVRKESGEFFTGVKAYGTVDEQAGGVRRWARSVEKFQAKAEVLDDELFALRADADLYQQDVSRADEAVASDPGGQEAVAQRQQAHAAMRALLQDIDLAKDDRRVCQEILDEAMSKHAEALSQSPGFYYGPASSRTVEQWDRLHSDLTVQSHALMGRRQAAAKGVLQGSDRPSGRDLTAAQRATRPSFLRERDLLIARLDEVSKNRQHLTEQEALGWAQGRSADRARG